MNVSCGGDGVPSTAGPIEHRMIRLRWQSCIIDGVACDGQPWAYLIANGNKHIENRMWVQTC
jgi:hypothetical protein